MKQTLYIFILSLSATITANAEQPDSTLVERNSLWRNVEKPTWSNPAIHKDAYNHPLTEISVSYDHRSEDKPMVEELGDGHSLAAIGVNTFLRLSERTAVWGRAAYMNGTVRNIRWNSTSDYELLSPYVLADTIGGNTKKEGYYFSGAYATELRKIALGAEMDFRAEHEYRDRDPRMRGVSTDLTLKAGAAMDIGAQRIGLAIEGNVYKQTNSVDFYNELGVSPEYQMTGLGTSYTRFSGDKRSLYFNGGGVSLTANSTPVSGNGVYADLQIGQRRYHRVLADYNSMPLTDLYHERIGGDIGWKREGDSRVAIYAHADYHKRSGDERIGGKSEVNAYPIIGKLTMYKSHQTDLHAGIVYGQKKWNAQLNAGYRSQQEQYVYPQRKLAASHLFGEAKWQLFTAPSKPLTLCIDAMAAYHANIDNEMEIPFADISATVADYINHKHDLMKANFTKLAIGVRANHKLRDPRYALFASLNAATDISTANATRFAFTIAVGATF